MKRILHTLFVAVLLVLSTPLWAQSETTTFTVYPSEGSYNKTGWCANWTSTTNEHPIASISVAGGINNMNADTKSGGFELAVGSNGNSNYTWNFSVLGYEIISYSFKFKSKENGKNVNVVAGGETIISSYSEEKTLTVDNVNAQVASFQLTGNNYAIIVTGLTFTVREILEEGQVYTFNNVAYEQRSLAANGTSDVHTKTTDAADKKQQWYVIKEGNYYVLRNVETGKYLQGSGQSSAWRMSDDYNNDHNKFELYPSNTTYNTLHTKTLGDHAYMHDSNNPENGGYNIVGWSNGDDTRASHWVITKVEYSDEELEVLFDNFIPEETIESALSEIFSDKACTTLKDNYSSISDEELKADANYKALPSVLKKLVEKVRSRDWSENNANATKASAGLNWESKYAQKFRVQMYEPYSIANDITNWLGINYHANNDNPTGIYVPAAGKLYIMVEGAIDEGATLRLVDAGSNDRILNATTRGNTLQQGLNVVEFTEASGMLYICYNVDTYNPNGTDDATRFPYKLSDYAPLKIHIEGGAINGFYNACGDFRATDDSDNLWKQITGASVDEDADWVYMETRANLSVLPVLGHRQILLFSLGETEGNNGMAYYLPENIDVPQTPYNRTKKWSDYGMGCDPSTGKINIMLEAWDRIMYSELATMGLVSKTDMAKMNEFYPRWNANGTVRSEIYDYSGTSAIDGKTLEEFCGVDYSEVFNHHGVALGVGGNSYMYGSGDHCGYNHNTMSGIIQTIASNAGSTWGPGHEIGHQHQGLLTLNGLTEVTNNLFANVALWYKGMSTSRYNGNDGSLEQVLDAFNTNGSDIYTNNIWALTHLYYRLWLYYHLAGNNTQFYPRLFELLRHEPMTGGGNVSGNTSTLHFYKLACQAAGEDLTEFFRAHGYFSVMEDRFVGDYSNSTYNVSQAMIDDAIAEVKAMRDAQGNPLKENLSILFINDDDEEANYLQHDGQTERVIYGETTPNSDFGSVSDFVAGNVATQYTATLNADGTVTMSGGEGGVGFLVLNEKGEIVSFSNKSTFALGDKAKLALVSGKATVVSVSSDNEVAPLEAEIDLTTFKKKLLSDLIVEAQAVVNSVDDTYTKVGSYKPSAVTDLSAAIATAQNVLANEAGYAGAYDMLYAEYREVIDNPASLIGIISGKKYAIKSKSGGDYMTVDSINVITNNSNTFPTTNDNLWIFETVGENYRIKHAGTEKYLQAVSDNNNVNYTIGDNAVDYTMKKIELGYYALSTVQNPGRYMNRNSNRNVITWNGADNNSQWTLTLYGEATEDDKSLVDLELLVSKTRDLLDKVADIDYIGDAYPLQADNITSNATENGHETKYLLDNSTSTFFHTVWASGSPGEPHYLQIDMGEENTIDQFVLSYSTIGQTNVDAPKTIEVKGSNSPDSGFQSITTLTSLPTTHLTSYTSSVLGTAGTEYRYLRFTVTDATGGKLGEYYYFGISELAIIRIEPQFNGMRANYANVSEQTVKAAIEAYEAARQAMTNGSGYADALSSLQAAYNNLVSATCAILTTKLQELKEITDATNALIAQVGSVTEPMSGEVALQTSDSSGAYYVSTNADQNTGGGTNDGGGIAALVDNKENTFFHTRWDGTVVNEAHYIQVDLGKSISEAEFVFSYKPRNGSPAPTAMTVYGSNDSVNFTNVLAEITSGLPAHNSGNKYTYASRLETNGYRYLRFTVTGSLGPGKETYEGQYFFGMLEFDLELYADLAFTLNNQYAETVGRELFESTYFTTVSSDKIYNVGTTSIAAGSPLVTFEMLDAQIADQQAAKAALEEAMTKVTVDKAALQELYDLASALYGEMIDENGNVKEDYIPATDEQLVENRLTTDLINAAKAALDAAKDKLDNSNSQTEVDDAKTALQAQYDALLAVKEANVNAEGSTFDKSGLSDLVAEAGSLLEAITNKGEGYYAAVAESLGADALNEALNTAQNVATRYYLTEGQYNDALTALQNCYNTTNGVVAADATDRQELTELIATMKGLLDETTGGAAQTIASLPLQASDKNAPYYIWSNAKSHDSSDVDALLDQNEDGSANTGTFFGTEWSNNPPTEDYIHYLEIDLGANVIENLAIDYTTRDSDHANQRPTGLKFFGSNDKNVYTEIHAITTGLATGRCEQWTMPAPIELEKNYRYIRVAVATEAHYFNMSDFNIYASSVATVNEFYSTSNIFDCLPAGLREYFDAKETVGAYVTEDDYETAKSELQAQIEALQGVIDSNFESRTSLETLVDDTEALIAEVATVDATEQPIALQCTNESAPYYIYCNAPYGNGTNNGDNAGVQALLDKKENGEPNEDTYMHTNYNGYRQDDDLDHYLRVDMGENSSVLEFKFSYIGRKNNNNNAPTKIVVEACDEPGGEYAPIVTIENIPVDASPAKYASDVITMPRAYRYIRFMVTETKNGASTTYNNVAHKFFALSHFAMTACMQVAVKEAYTPQLSASVVAATYKEKVEGDFVATHYAVESTYTATLEALQNAYDNLAAQMLDRSGLNALIASTNELCGSVNASENPTLYIYNTAELLAETRAAIPPASELLGQKVVTKAQYDAVLATLQAAYDKLLFAINHKNVPVKLTTDVNNPVLYKIKINRGGDKRLQYDAASAMVAVADEYVGNKAQAWFFMSGADATKDVLILPYTGEGKVLATNSFSEGDSKVKVVESTADGYSNNWNIVAIADSEWSNITILNGSGATFYFSNHGGVSKKMGFYNTTPSTDGGSMFQFVLDETDYSLSDAYYALLNQYNDCGGEVTYGTIIGTYSEVTGTAYNTAYNTAAILLDAKNSTDDEYEDARTALATAYDGLEYNGGLCRIRSAYTGGYSTNKLIYVNADGNPLFEAATDEYLSKYIWEFVPVQGGYHLKSLHTQSYVTAAGWGAQVVLGDEDDAKLVTVDFLDDENGIVRLNVQGGYPLHAQETGSKLVGYTGGLGTASAWYVEEVEGENINKIKLNISLNTISGDSKSYSTLYSAFPVELPGGVDAHVITARNENYLSMDAITDAQNRVVPAYTAVILTAEKVDASSAGTITCDALYNDEATVATFDERENLLIGTIKAEYIECADANEWVYTLGKGGSGIAMYKSKKNYLKVENVNNEGTVTSVTYNKVDNTGDHVKLGANKAYLLLGGGSQGTISTYSFQFGGGTTGIFGVAGENPLEGTIYDLHGRKLSEINTPGYYIINGKKTYVSEVK